MSFSKESPARSKSRCFLKTRHSFIKVRSSLSQFLWWFRLVVIIIVLRKRFSFALVLEYCQSFVLKLSSWEEWSQIYPGLLQGRMILLRKVLRMWLKSLAFDSCFLLFVLSFRFWSFSILFLFGIRWSLFPFLFAFDGLGLLVGAYQQEASNFKSKSISQHL